jgi:hypothetical protein
MEFGLEIAKAIAELGILVVIAGIFLWFAIRTNKQQEATFDTLFKQILEQLKANNGGHVLTEEEDRDAIRIDTMINSYLDVAVRDLKASRVMVARYHNGGKDMNAVSFLKVSVTNERVNKGYLPVMGDFQNQFRSMVALPIREIDRTGRCNIPNLEEIKDRDIGTYELLKARKVRAVYCHALKSLSGYPVGAIMVLYNEDNPIKENEQEVTDYLNEVSAQISALFNMKKEQPLKAEKD